MVSFGHTAVGVIVGVTAYNFLGQTNVAEGLILTGTCAFISHYIMDTLPHGHFINIKNYKIGLLPIIIFDLSFSIILFLTAAYFKNGFGDRFFYIMFGIGGSQLPDVIDGLIYKKILKAKGLLKMEYDLHSLTHWHGDGIKTLPLGMGDIWQALVVTLAFISI